MSLNAVAWESFNRIFLRVFPAGEFTGHISVLLWLWASANSFASVINRWIQKIRCVLANIRFRCNGSWGDTELHSFELTVFFLTSFRLTIKCIWTYKALLVSKESLFMLLRVTLINQFVNSIIYNWILLFLFYFLILVHQKSHGSHVGRSTDAWANWFFILEGLTVIIRTHGGCYLIRTVFVFFIILILLSLQSRLLSIPISFI